MSDAPVKYGFLKNLVRRSIQNLPPWRICDIAGAYPYFWFAHRRNPGKKRMLFNDYLFRLKLSRDIENPLRVFTSDKELAKIFYRGVLQEDLAPRTIVKFDDFESLANARIPQNCVIKPTHLSGEIIYVDDVKTSLTPEELERARAWFRTNMYYDLTRERNYRLLKPTVICEECIVDANGIRDYKFFCFGGKARVIQVDTDRQQNHKRRLYDVDWRPLDFRFAYPLAEIEPRPVLLDQAVKIANQLASYFEFVRVDMYFVGDRIYLGELTHVPECSHGRFDDLETERKFSELLFGS